MKLQLIVTFLAASATLGAQPSATWRPALLETFESGWSWSSREEVALSGGVVAEVAVTRFDLSLSGRAGLNEQTSLVYGLAYATNRFDASAAILPDELSEVSLNVGFVHRRSPAWSLAAFLRPGIYGDFDQLDGKSFNAPLIATAAYSPSTALTWRFGLNLNAFSENPVLPILGVRWQFAPQWTFNVGFPRSGLIWDVSDKISLGAGVGFQGGSFRVNRDPRPTPASVGPSLANTYLDYREIRAGLSFDYALTPALELSLDAGVIADRKFDWFDRDYQLDGDGGISLAISLKGSF